MQFTCVGAEDDTSDELVLSSVARSDQEPTAKQAGLRPGLGAMCLLLPCGRHRGRRRDQCFSLSEPKFTSESRVHCWSCRTERRVSGGRVGSDADEGSNSRRTR